MSVTVEELVGVIRDQGYLNDAFYLPALAGRRDITEILATLQGAFGIQPTQTVNQITDAPA